MRKNIFKLSAMILATAIIAATTACAPKKDRQKQILDIKGQSGYIFVNEEGIIEDNKMTYFHDIIAKKIKTDGEITLPDEEYSSIDVTAVIYKDIAYYSFKYNEYADEEEKTAYDYVVGYVDLYTKAVTYYKISSSVSTYVRPIKANDGYIIFDQMNQFYVYFVIDKQNSVLIENLSEYETYLDGTENAREYVYENGKKYEVEPKIGYGKNSTIVCGKESLTIDYEYVLARSEEMKTIDGIVGKYKRDVFSDIFARDNRLFAVLQSKVDLFGKGELIPVVFEYRISSDSFEYIGSTDKAVGGNHLRAVLPPKTAV